MTRKRFLLPDKRLKKYFSLPQYTFIDSYGQWWMTASYGEFGGSVQIFDTEKAMIANNDFLGVDNGLLFPKSVFEDDKKQIFITSGLQHFSNWGEIYKITADKRVTKVYDGTLPGDTIKNKINTLFIGAGTYNKANNNIYFSSNNGIYKALSTDVPLKPVLVFTPQLSWSREPMAIGYGMAVKKMEFTDDGKLVLLTANDGFIIYDGKTLTMLK